MPQSCPGLVSLLFLFLNEPGPGMARRQSLHCHPWVSSPQPKAGLAPGGDPQRRHRIHSPHVGNRTASCVLCLAFSNILASGRECGPSLPRALRPCPCSASGCHGCAQVCWPQLLLSCFGAICKITSGLPPKLTPRRAAPRVCDDSTGGISSEALLPGSPSVLIMGFRFTPEHGADCSLTTRPLPETGWGCQELIAHPGHPALFSTSHSGTALPITQYMGTRLASLTWQSLAL